MTEGSTTGASPTGTSTTGTLLVDPACVGSATRFAGRLIDAPAAAGWRVEGDPARLGDGLAVVTCVDPAVAEALDERREPFVILVLPGEPVHALTPAIARRATRVVVVGGSHPDIPIELPRPKTAAEAALRAVELPAASVGLGAAGGEGRALGDAVTLALIEDYARVWEAFVAARAVPSRVRVLAGRGASVPPWFLHEVEARGAAVEVVIDRPAARRAILANGDRLVRDNRHPDAFDVDLRRAGRSAINVHPRVAASRARTAGSTDASASAKTSASPDESAWLDADGLVSWAQVLEACAGGGAPGASGTPAAGPETGEPVRITPERDGTLNIVCFRPNYLFGDLTERFVAAGCVHSDVPLKGARAHIWLRPQELGAFTDLAREERTVDVGAAYIEVARPEAEGYSRKDAEALEARSVAIHHGTCFPPMIQFDPYRLAQKLATVRKVAGVCELVECYGPSAPHANPHNFEFVPIGYDHTLYTADKVRTETRPARARLRIGFVGRAYGTPDREKLEASQYAHPLGYRKGGDHLVQILLRLHAAGVDFELQLIGNRWERHVAELESFGIDVVYFARDKNITYRDYPGVFASFDALLIAARAEGGPVAAIEAMSVGVPVVGTDVGVVPYLERTTKHCWTHRYDTKWHVMDHAAAAAALTRLWEKPFTYEERMAVRRSVERHTTDRWIRRVMELAES